MFGHVATISWYSKKIFNITLTLLHIWSVFYWSWGYWIFPYSCSALTSESYPKSHKSSLIIIMFREVCITSCGIQGYIMKLPEGVATIVSKAVLVRICRYSLQGQIFAEDGIYWAGNHLLLLSYNFLDNKMTVLHD